MKKKSVSVESQTHGDTAMCCLLFYDWYVQKIKKNKESK